MGNGSLLLVVVLVAAFFVASEQGWLRHSDEEPEPTSTPYPTYTPNPTPTPTSIINPTPTPSLNNLAVFPQDWSSTYSSGSQIIFIDYNVKHGACSCSFRLEPHSWLDVNFAREINFDGAISVNAGDRIIFSCWVFMADSESGKNGVTDKGGRIGLDFYGASGNLGIGALVNGVGSDSNHISGWLQADGSFVPYGSNCWVKQTIDCVVPEGYGITAFIPWMQVLPADDAGFGWFSDTEIYVYNVD